MSDQPVATGRLTGRTAEANVTLRQDCPAPAPLVVNGGGYVGCSREAGHDGPHTVTITWGA
jgi:hypothetical protein